MAMETSSLGFCIGSESQRVLAYEVVDSDGDKQIRETVNRIVEFGLGYRSEVIEDLCSKMGVVPAVVTDQAHDDELP